MRPILFETLSDWLGPQTAAILTPGWFTFVGLAGLVAGLFLYRNARASGADVAAVTGAAVWGYVAAVACGILVPMIADAATHAIDHAGHVRLRWAGMFSWCGYTGGFLAVLLVLRRSGKVSPARFGDLAAAPLGLALAIGRLGCFVAGCDYGQVTSAPWAVRFPAGSAAWRAHVSAGYLPPGRESSLPVHPTQLYEILLGLGLCALAIGLGRSRWARERAGRVFLATAGAYAVGRMAIEALRGDAGRGLLGAVSSAQVFGAIVLAAVALVAWRRRGRAAVALACLALLCAAPIARAGAPEEEPESAPESAEDAPADEPIDPYAPEGGEEETPAAPEEPVAAPEEPAAAPAEPEPAPAPAADPAPESPPAQVQKRAAAPRYELGVLLGTATPLNRRARQVPPLAGASLSASLALRPGLTAGLELERMANEVASHGSFLAVAAFHRPLPSLSPRARIGGRAGLALTVVNFHDPAFRDVVTSGFRVGFDAGWALSDRLLLLVRPFTLDLIGAPAIGGPIFSYQFRVGLAYRAGG